VKSNLQYYGREMGEREEFGPLLSSLPSLPSLPSPLLSPLSPFSSPLSPLSLLLSSLPLSSSICVKDIQDNLCEKYLQYYGREMGEREEFGPLFPFSSPLLSSPLLSPLSSSICVKDIQDNLCEK
jgi:hypothetical protein